MGGALEAGVEVFRLHGVRALAGGQLMIPFFDGTHQQYASGYDPATNSTTLTTTTVAGRAVYPAAFLRLAF